MVFFCPYLTFTYSWKVDSSYFQTNGIFPEFRCVILAKLFSFTFFCQEVFNILGFNIFQNIDSLHVLTSAQILSCFTRHVLPRLDTCSLSVLLFLRLTSIVICFKNIGYIIVFCVVPRKILFVFFDNVSQMILLMMLLMVLVMMVFIVLVMLVKMMWEILMKIKSILCCWLLIMRACVRSIFV